jgi:hypothetical protein
MLKPKTTTTAAAKPPPAAPEIPPTAADEVAGTTDGKSQLIVYCEFTEAPNFRPNSKMGGRRFTHYSKGDDITKTLTVVCETWGICMRDSRDGAEILVPWAGVKFACR